LRNGFYITHPSTKKFFTLGIKSISNGNNTFPKESGLISNANPKLVGL
jgi:hypothetical protein